MKKSILSLVALAALSASTFTANAQLLAVGGSAPRPQAVGGSAPRPQAVGGSAPRPQTVGSFGGVMNAILTYFGF